MVKAPKSLKKTDLRPYLAPVLLAAFDTTTGARLLSAVVKEIETDGFKSTGRVERQILESVSMGTASDLRLHAIVYSERVSPAWYGGGAFRNLTHELLVVAVRDKHVMICASDGIARDRVVKKLKAARPLPPSALAGFVGAEAAAIWLNGVHTPTSVKANSKMLNGVSLEYALDPLGDQTYRYSAIRSHPSIPGLKDLKDRSLMVGAAPDSARVWVGRPADWDRFTAQLAAILEHVLSKKPGADLYGFLAQPVDSPTGVKEAYEIAIVPGELLSEDVIGEEEREEARIWAYDASFNVTGTNGLALDVEPFLSGQRLGRLTLKVDLVEGVASIAATWTDEPAGLAAQRSRCTAMLTAADKVKIFYESGHTLMQGRCYVTGFTDQPFTWKFVPMKGFKVDREKPPLGKGEALASKIGLAGDVSLFGLVVNQMFSAGWLACDDGSMELADFIHVDPANEVVTLIHVKASASEAAARSVSVADYEIVVSQAVKNVRHLDRRNLVSELRDGKAKKIGAAVWKDGQKQANRDGFLAAVEALPPTAARVAMVLQPRLTSTEHKACANPKVAKGRGMRMKQLNALMLSARLSAMACGAEFHAFGEEL